MIIKTKGLQVGLAGILVVAALVAYEHRERLSSTLMGEYMKMYPKQISLVFGPMVPITVEGKTVKALGTDICPGQESNAMRLMFGETADAGQRQCIVGGPTTAKVHVSLLVDGALGSTEAWAVERDGNRLSFRRPDGSLVMAASDKSK